MRPASRWPERCWVGSLRGLGHPRWRTARASVVLAAVMLLACVAFGLAEGFPVPRVHDEFAYLLLGDTFAAGRITNPTHPMWEHFETLHVIHLPTYTAKYPPGQGFLLGLGQALLGHPAWGLWLALAMLSAALVWMLSGWLPRRWALLGAGLASIQLGIATYWSHSYWGGTAAAVGGALVYGALPRLWACPKRSAGVALGAGLLILSVSRPLEGLVAAVPAVAALLWKWARSRERSLSSALLPAIGLVLVAAVWNGYYDWRTTGDPLRLPYQVYEARYSPAPTFLWEAPRAPGPYRNAEIEEFQVDHSLVLHERLRDPVRFLEHASDSVLDNMVFYAGPMLLFLVGLPIALRSGWIRLALGVIGLTGLLVLFTKRGWPHYLAPVAGLVYLVLIASARAAYRESGWPRRPVRLSWIVVVLSVAGVAGLRVGFSLAKDPGKFQRERTEVIRRLTATPGRDLVLVRYLPEHRRHYELNHEFVYNAAEIDGAEIVWARSLGPAADLRLMEYFGDRSVWRLEVGSEALLRRTTGDHGTGRREETKRGEGGDE